MAQHRDLVLQGAMNVRDLGGLPAADGRTVALGRFVRADGLAHLTETDREGLHHYGVRCVVDLRSRREAEAQPGRLEGYRDIRCHGVPLLDDIHSLSGSGELPDSLASLYRHMLDRQREQFCRALAILSRADGCALYHCTAGKDRTGLVTLLLLLLAGTPDEAIIGDYVRSQDNLEPFIQAQLERLRGQYDALPEYLFRSPADAIHTALTYVRDTYGGAEGYLSAAPAAEAMCRLLRGRLWGEG